MQIFSDIFFNLLEVFCPQTCPLCGRSLLDNEIFACTSCRFTAPLTNMWRSADNPMTERLAGLLPVQRASAFIWFIEGSRWQQVIHKFKYSGMWLYAQRMGEWFGGELADSGLYADIDTIIPVPLHWRKRMERTYNQSEYIADGISNVLGPKVDRRSLFRRENNPSQTLNSADERWKNVEGIFGVRNPEALRGKHILLVDDVFTTGATLTACGSAILEAAGAENVKISIATIAATQRSMAIDK